MRAFSADLLTGAAVAVASLILSAPECRAAAAESAASPAATSPTPSSDFGFAYDPQDFFELTIGAPVPRGIDRLGTEGLELESRSEADDGVLYIFSDPDQPGFRASLLLREGRLVGVIDHPNELRTTITSVRAGFSVARVDDALKDLTCGCEERHLTRDPNGPDDGGGDGGVAGGPCDNGTKVDVLVVYTSAAVTQAGSTASLLDSINWAMADSNSIYAGSGVALQARLVGTALVTYTENADMGVDLDRLTGTSDGFMDNIHTIRNNVGADLVALVRADGGGACGIAHLLPSNSSANANKGFSVTALGCFSNRTFTHEMGHNMGCCHAPGDGGGCTSGGVFSYSVGHRFFGTDGQQYRTVMAYTPGTRIPRFSSPVINWAGTATGIAGQRENARTINETRLAFTNFRCSADGIGSCGAGGNCYAVTTTAGCTKVSCCEAVCANDSYCCLTAWDALCVSQAIDICTTCGESGSGSCFEAHPTPSCNDAACCGDVCAVDAFCCNVGWDSICVQQAVELCPNCGDAETGSCYIVNGSPFCDNATCCNAVCAADAFCCEVTWDSACVTQAIDICPGCGNPEAGSCYVANGSRYCEDASCCQAVCASDPFCCNTTWDGVCAASAVAICPGCGNPNNEGCLVAHVSPYCNDATCCSFVCDNDPFCCSTQWDAFCVNGANTLCVQTCGGPLAGSCCTAHANPYCNDAACCDIVCDLDPFCCSSQWDAICANRAKITCSSCVPDNDTCAGAQAIGTGSFGFGNVGASGNTSVSCGTGTLYNDVWFTYTANAYGQCTISTCNAANFDTMIAVFAGSCATGLTQVACNDDATGCSGFTSSVSFNALCGVQYTVVVGGWSPTSRGTGTISLSQTGTCVPPNDTCAGATSLGAGSTLFSTNGATGTFPFSCGAGTLHNDVWFTYSPTASGTTTLSTCNTASFDTMIGVYTGSCAAGLGFVACNDDSAGCALTSRVTFNAQCGTVYYIALGGYSSAASGTGTITVTPGSTSCCPGDLNGDGTRNAQDLAALLGAWGSSNPAADLNGDGIVNALDLAALLGGWGPC